MSRTPSDRENTRWEGLGSIEIGLPNVHSPEFVAEARRQSKLVAQSVYADEDQAFIDSVSDLSDP